MKPKPPSVFALITDGHGVEGGIARYNVALLTALSESSGISSVAVLARRVERSAHAGAQKIRYARAAATKASLVVAGLQQALSDDRHDIVLCGHLNMLPLAWGLSRRWGAKLWLQLHGIECWSHPRAHIRLLAERCDLITCVSRYTRRRMLAWCDLEPTKVRVLPNTLSAQFDYPSAARTGNALVRPGVERTLRTLTVARLSAEERYKGHDVMIEAVAMLALEGVWLNYAIAGDGGDRRRLELLALRLNVDDRVRFLGRVPEGDLPSLYDNADVFVMPSTGEGFGIVFLEARQRGCAVIASNADGSVDPLRDGADGYLVPPNNPRALADLLRTLAQSPAVANASTNVFSKVAFDAHVDRLLPLLA